MPRSTWPLQEAKRQFSMLVEAARRGPQTVTEHGRPVVVVMAASEYEQLRRIGRLNTPTFADHLLAMPRDDKAFERL